MKQLIQNVAGRLSYELHRKKPPSNPPFRPFVQQVSLVGVTFDFWVVDPTSVQWYDAAAHQRREGPFRRADN
jgi:hypothetical protein